MEVCCELTVITMLQFSLSYNQRQIKWPCFEQHVPQVLASGRTLYNSLNTVSHWPH